MEHLRIKNIKIEKLFGEYDYTIDMHEDKSDIVILCGENGIGKTTIISIVDAFLNLDYEELENHLFKKVTIFFTSGDIISVEKKKWDLTYKKKIIKRKYEELKKQRIINSKNLYSNLTFYCNDEKGKYNYEVNYDYSEEAYFLNEIVEDSGLPFYMFFEDLFGGILYDEDRFPNVFTQVIKGNDVFETDRYSEYDYSKTRISSINSFEDIESHLYRKVDKVRDEFMKKDSFSTEDIYEFINQTEYKYSIKDIKNLYNKIKTQKEWLWSLDIWDNRGIVSDIEEVDKFFENPPTKLSQDRLDMMYKVMENIYNNYLIYNNIGLKMELYKKIIDSLFTRKTMFYEEEDLLEDGEPCPAEIETTMRLYFCISKSGKKKEWIGLDSLSSGEKNLIVMYYKLIFADCTNDDSFVFIDEPETSLHIAWQRDYIDILSEILKLRGNTQCIVVTHSPSIIGEHSDITNVLEG